MPKKVIRILVDKYGFKEDFFRPSAKINLLLPEKDVKTLKSIADRESKDIGQLFLEALCDKYKGKFMSTAMSDFQNAVMVPKEQFAVNTVLKLAGQPNKTITVGHPAIGTFSVSVVPEPGIESGTLKLFVSSKDNGWNELTEEQKDLLCNILEEELYIYYQENKKFVPGGYVGAASVVRPAPESPFCPDMNEIIRLLKKYGGAPKNDYFSYFFPSFYIGLINCVNSGCEDCKFNLSKILFKSEPHGDFVLCASAKERRDAMTARFEEDAEKAKEFISMPLPNNYPAVD